MELYASSQLQLIIHRFLMFVSVELIESVKRGLLGVNDVIVHFFFR